MHDLPDDLRQPWGGDADAPAAGGDWANAGHAAAGQAPSLLLARLSTPSPVDETRCRQDGSRGWVTHAAHDLIRSREWRLPLDARDFQPAFRARTATVPFVCRLALASSVAVPTFLGDLLRADAVVSGAYYYP